METTIWKTMGKKHLFIVSVLFMCLSGFPLSTAAEDFQVVGAEFPPLMYEKEGKPAGFYFDLLQMMLKEMPHTITVKFYPVPRMLMMLAKSPDMFALGIARNAKREQEYKWVGPTIQPGVVLYKLKNRSDIHIQTLADARPYKIGTGQAYAAKENLLQAGIPDDHIEEVTVDVQNIKKLFAQRIDLVITIDVVFLDLLRQEGHSTDEVEAFRVDGMSMYYAFNKNTADQVILQFQQTLDRLKQTESYKELVKKYLPE